jgi:hypothetical protein
MKNPVTPVFDIYKKLCENLLQIPINLACDVQYTMEFDPLLWDMPQNFNQQFFSWHRIQGHIK